MAISLIRPAKYFLTISAALVIASIVLMFVPGPNMSIDFTGGSLMEIVPPEGTQKEAVEEALSTYVSEPPLGNVFVAATQDGSMLLRMRDITNEEHLALLEHLSTRLGEVRELQFLTIGPTVGEALKTQSFWALGIAAVGIIVYIAIAFRKVPRKLSPWRFGIIAIVTVLHDVIITVGIFVIISKFTTFEVDTLFITALLTILGYSVNDTIIIFDRIRENLADQGRKEEFAEVANRSLVQSLRRSLNTGFCTLIMLFALLFFGSESIRWFVLTLIVGILIGSYSSIFLATPLLVYWKKRQ